MLEPLTLGQWILLLAVVFVSAGVQGMLGFGFGLAALPILGYLMPARVPQVLILVGLPAALYVVWHERGTPVRPLRWVLLGRLLGTVPGAVLVVLLPVAGLQIAFSVTVLLAVAVMSAPRVRVTLTPRKEFGAGVLSALMGTTTSIGGPVLAVLYSSIEGHQLRAVMAWVLLAGNLLSLAGLRFAGRLGLADLATAAVLAGPMAVGVVFGSAMFRRLSGELVRKAVLLLAAAAAVLLLVQALARVGAQS